MVHPLADAHTPTRFATDWARTTNARINNNPRLLLSTVFDPALLDKQAIGDIDKPFLDPKLIKDAESLPLHRYDWWAPSPDCPWPTEVPAPFRNDLLQPVGKPLPRSEWDVTAPVSHDVAHLIVEQIQRIRENVSSKSTTPLSRHDAIVAHIWSCINCARGLEGDEGQVHGDLVCGMCNRLSLGEDFLGSATIMIDVAVKSSEACSTGTAWLGAAIRTTLAKIDQRGLQVHLHSVAYEQSPQRIWQAFPGRRHVLLTSWVRAGVYNLDFGGGMVPRYVKAIMPDMDGLVELKEAPPSVMKL